MHDAVVCTISREGTPEMNDMIVQTIRGLKECRFSITAVHVEAGNKSLSREIKSACRVSVIKPTPQKASPFYNAWKVSDLLLGGVRDVITSVAANETRAIVYMEGDKCTFVPSIGNLIEPILENRADLTLAVRSPEGFSKFPRVQQIVERRVNSYIGKKTGIQTDYLYGPRAFSPQVGSLCGEYGRNDWGVIMYPVVSAIAKGYRLEQVKIEGYPQPDYMKKYDLIMRSPPAHFAWRLIQNAGMVRATNSALKKL
jgi:hypothetical protein